MSQVTRLFSDKADDYRQFRPTYPKSLYDWLQARAGSAAAVWEAGAGSGQATGSLASRFRSVLATDASAEQLALAPSYPNVSYQVTAAESCDLEPESVDLVVVAQAIHWFDLERFFERVEQALRPGGLLAVWGYQFVQTDTAIDEHITRFHSNILGPYWPPQRVLLDTAFTRIAFPYPALELPEFQMAVRWPLAHLLGYLKTWSAVKQYQAQHQSDPVAQIEPVLSDCWGDPKQEREIRWPLILYVGQKPV